MSKSIALFLSMILVFHISSGMRVPENSSMTFNSMGQLVGKASEAYLAFFAYATQLYGELFEKVLEISHSDAEPDPEIQSAVEPFVDYVKQIKEMPVKTRESFHSLFNECKQLADKYDHGVPVDASEADHKIAKYMNEANAMKTKFDVLMMHIGSLQLFANNVRKYLNSLSDEDRMKQKKLQQWYHKWQCEHDLEEKNALMLNFFEIFDNSKDDRTKLVDKVVRNIALYLNDIVMARKDFFKNKVIIDIGSKFKKLNEAVKYPLEILKGFVHRAENVNQLKDKDRLVELLRLFSAAQEIEQRFKRTDLTDEDKDILKIMQNNGEMNIKVRQILLTYELGDELTEVVEEYLEEDKNKEDKLVKWFEEVQEEVDFYNRSQTLVSLLEVLAKMDDDLK